MVAPLTTFTVNSLADTTDAQGCDATNCTLREAIAAANANAGADTISFSVNGTITLSSALPGLSSDMTISGPGANLLSVSRDSGAATRFRIFTVTSGVTVSISDLTVTGGLTADGTSASNGVEGGGILNSGTLILTGVSVVANQTGKGGDISSGSGNINGGDGGGIYNLGTLSITNSIISSNQTGKGGNSSGTSLNSGGTGGNGGGIHNQGTLTLTNSTISGNQTGGGGVQNISKGSGGGGGGIYNQGTLIVSSSTISGNQTGGGGSGFGANGGNGGNGGGLLNSSGTLSISNSTLSGNSTGAGTGGLNFSGSGGNGGGINNGNGGLTISNSTISGNTTGKGAGGGLIGVAGNGGNGGGINNGSGGLTIGNSTIAANSAAGGGGGISKEGAGNINLRSTIVGVNTASDAPDIRGSVISDGYNLIGDTDGATINQNPGAGPNITDISPRLGPLADNGGPTKTHTLASTSPAIDQGNRSGVLATDQRGLARVNFPGVNDATGGDGADIGAFELQSLITASGQIIVNSTADAASDDGQCTLREAITSANTDFASGAAANECAAGSVNDTIIFDPVVFAAPGPHVISLLTELPDVMADMTIQGPAANVLTVERNSGAATRFRVFTIISGTVTISGMTIAKGFTGGGGDGGGIQNAGILTLSRITVSGNRAGEGGLSSPGWAGGGIYNSGTLTVTDSTISGNNGGDGGGAGRSTGAGQGGFGGGIRNTGTLDVKNSTISGNHAGNGGGMGFVDACCAGGGGNGGGIDNFGTLTISNSTISGNTPGNGAAAGRPLTGNGPNGAGGGLTNEAPGAITLRNTIVAGNSGTHPDIDGAVQSGGFNLIQNLDGATVTPNPFTGPNITGQDPLLGPLQDNGGPTPTHALFANSPAIDKGNDFSVTATTDQRGQPRPFDNPLIPPAIEAGISGDNTDIGAYEVIGVLQTGSPSFIVNTTADTNDYACTVEAGGCTLREAISAANSAPGANVISFLPSLTSGGAVIINLTSVLPDLSSDITINSPGANLLAVNRDVTARFRIFTVTSGVTVNISGLTITGGLTADGSNGSSSGTGVEGGGIRNAGTLTLTGASVSANRTGQGGNGGFFSNGGAGGPGAGIYNSGALTIINSIINSNTAGKGGNGFIGGAGGPGGGIHNQGNLTIVNSTISSNTTGASGTGVPALSGPGGGINNANGTLTIISSTISSNAAGASAFPNSGGGLNQSGSGGITLRSTIVAGNFAVTGSDINGTVQSNGYNLIQNTNGATINETQNPGTNITTVSPNLGPLALNGGPMPTHKLLPNSPAMDKGDDCVFDNSCSPALGSALTLDQRGAGFTRKAGAHVDIGAFEANYAVTTTAGNIQTAASNTAFGIQLKATITESGMNQSGILVTFTAPISGVSGSFQGTGTNTASVTTDGSGVATAPVFTANSLGGSYLVIASIGTGLPTASFNLTNNATPTITAAGGLSRQQGSSATNSQIASVTDDGGSGGVGVTVTSANPANGFTVSNIHNTGGAITADISADCSASNASFTLQASDGLSTSAATLNVTVTANTAPTLTYTNPPALATNGSTTVTPATASDNGSVNSYSVQSVVPALTTAPTVNSSGVVAITNAQPAGTHTITIRAKDNCGMVTDASFTLTVNKIDQTITGFGALPNKTFGDPDFNVSPTATSGLPVSLAASLNCTVTSPSPGTVHITGAGGCTITASRAGNANFNGAPDQVRSFTSLQAASSPAVSSSVNPSEFNQSVTFTATVAGPAGTGTPTGTVQFKDSGANLGAPVALNASGVAPFNISSLTTGNHNITAEYSGDKNFLAVTGTLSAGQVVKAQPSLSIGDVSISEGNAGTSTLNFTVSLSAASSLTVSVDYILSDGTAKSPGDYQATSGTLTFNPGVTTQTIPVIINGDVSFEPDETFSVNLSKASNATISDNQGIGTIQNDDVQGGIISFSQANTNVNESAGIVTLSVVRTNDVSQAANVDYATDDTGASTNCAALNTGLAAQRCDFATVLGTLKFAAGETQQTLIVPINLDAYAEGPETFTVKLANPTNGAVLAVPSTTVVTINDSVSPTPNAIDDTTTFVRQQYRDFLNREADPAGLAFWKNNIDKCNDPAQRPAGQTLAQCIEVQRTRTSAAFFLSIEFKQTGGLVRDFYVAALERPATNNMPNYIEFMRDTQAIQRGVIVGQGNWQQVLDANRIAFMNEFVMRPEFVGLYPTTDTPAQYVDKLYQHARVAPVTNQERLDAILEFSGATTAADPGARGRAQLRITQNATFQTREANPMFVQIEYFGYLRRNPNDPPDNNFNGFNVWLNKLNQFNGDYFGAELIKAFIQSNEYRQRFGQ
jgi:CSLREA domain-containing protein